MADSLPGTPASRREPVESTPGAKRRLVVLSFLMLFVELALIRWTGSNILYLSYFSNFVLLGSFLGIGVGFLRARSKVNLFRWSPVALALLVLFVRRFPVKIDRTGSGLLFFGEFTSSGLPIWATLPVIFLAVAAVMAMIAEGVARQFGLFPPLEAYRLDMMGSIAGIAAFSLLSFANAPPVFWGLAVAAVFASLLWSEAKRPATVIGAAALVALVTTLSAESMAPDDHWSPYYKIHLERHAEGWVDVSVNGIPHQLIESTEMRRTHETFYFTPYEYRSAPGPPRQVLIVGAGTGSDVAIALAQGVERVDAVEIDPRLQDFGEQLHPDRPYDSGNVAVTINDGRAFLERTDRTYDLIVFALPDSLTLVSGQSSLRLESYLFTREAMESARNHLEPGGVFAMYNYYRERWLVDRLANTLESVYGQAPCADVVGPEGGGLAVLLASSDAAALNCPTRWSPTGGPVTPPATDDRPFLYLRENKIPGFYLVTIGLILAASVLLVRGVAGPFGRMRDSLDLFFMGAAFLLLETKNVVQFALLFGTTWFVNALVFGGILLTVLAAVEVARRVRFGRPALIYGLLFAALGVAWLVPTGALITLAVPVRFVVATLLAFAPVFLANLVFAERFRETESSRTAFGANLLGAMVGGVLEYSALAVGYRMLLVLTAVLYGVAFWAGRAHLRSRGRFFQAA